MQNSKIEKILIVDNDPVFLSLTAKFLKKDGYQVLAAKDAVLALEILKSTTPDVILLDLVMPIISGQRLCRMIREQDTPARFVDIIIITAIASEGVTVDYIGMGAQDCIAKGPFQKTYKKIKEALSGLEQSHRELIQDKTPCSAEMLPRNIVGELISINRHLETLISNISDGIIELTEDGKIIFANPMAITILGRSEMDTISTQFIDLFRNEEREKITRLLSDGDSALNNASYCLLNDREVTVKVLPVKSIEKKSFLILHDVTEQKFAERILLKAYTDLEDQVEERTAELAKANRTLSNELEGRRQMETMLQQSRNTLRSVVDNISDPLILVDQDFTIRMANRATLDYFNSADYLEILEYSFLDLLKDHYDHHKLASIRSAILNFKKLSFEADNYAQTGKYEKVVIYPIHDECRTSGSAICRISDITKEKIMTSELIQKEKLASLGLLISSISHEINNPNNIILFNIPILKDYLQVMLPIIHEYSEFKEDFEIMGMSYEAFHEDLIKLVANIENGAERINNTVTKLLNFSRKRNDQKKKPVEPGLSIEKAISICKNEIRKTVNQFDVDVEANLPILLTDSEALEQVIINLLINASHASDKKDSWIKLKAYLEANKLNNKDYFSLEISDNGCGMDEDTKKKIFIPFFTTKKNGLGTGLGLYIVKSLVDEMAGNIEIQSEPGKGSTFHISIPLTEKNAVMKYH